ncbi:hypothetical protein [Nocardioides sp. InS609-2]|uniref:hypothetical protein n=1 Tax=Nocardioides sp. InS609-2 TaxID=2760705 RepID=UPI0020BDB194|nr:hypothetical protein [Nocardioides sp. InS609-2]
MENFPGQQPDQQGHSRLLRSLAAPRDESDDVRDYLRGNGALVMGAIVIGLVLYFFADVFAAVIS